MRNLVCVAGLVAALVMMAPTDADAKKNSKSKKSPQVAGFLQVSSSSNSGGLLRSYEQGRQYDRVAGNDNVGRFFNGQGNRGGGN